MTMNNVKRMAIEVSKVAELIEELQAGEGGLVDVTVRQCDLMHLLDEIVNLGILVQEAAGRTDMTDVTERDTQTLADTWMECVG
jgi:hypothetical protein